MPVTELVTLALKAGSSVDTIKAQLLQAGKLQATVAGYPLHFFSTSTFETESTIGSDKKGEPENIRTKLVLIGGWDSVPAHEEWIASETNQSIMTSLSPHIEVDSVRHLDIDPRSLSLANTVEIIVCDAKENVGSSGSNTTGSEGNRSFQLSEASKDGWSSFAGRNVETESNEYVILRTGSSRNADEADVKEDQMALNGLNLILRIIAHSI